jgi:hypothetical protein
MTIVTIGATFREFMGRAFPEVLPFMGTYPLETH